MGLDHSAVIVTLNDVFQKGAKQTLLANRKINWEGL